MRNVAIVIAIAALAACNSEAPKPAEAAKPDALKAGEYELVSEVTKLASTDKSTPATKLKLGDKATVRACVAADGALDPAMFMEKGDSCTPTTSYMASGRLSLQYQCNRAGKGALYLNADGNFTADSFEAVATQASSFSGDGDYALTRHLTGKRVGDCPATAAAPKA